MELIDPVADCEARTVVGARFVIRLTENPTTGFRWQFEVTDPGIVELLGDDYVSDGKLAGSGGVRSFSFRGTRPGTTAIRFTLRRAWETAPPIRSLMVSASVGDR